MCPKNYDDYLKHLGKNYLLDLITIVKHEAFRGINKCHKAQSEKDKHSPEGLGFLEGYALAYSRVISIMMQQTIAYNIPLADLGLDDIDPDKDLMPGA